MTEKWLEINPQSKFILTNDSQLSDTQRESLDVLYQPIVGSLAYTLINVLWRMSQEKESTKEHNHVELLTYLNSDIKSIVEARTKLEAVGLIKTFLKRQNDSQSFVYQLVSPLEATKFFMDDLLSVSLLQIIGEYRYLDIFEQLKTETVSLEGYEDISQNFLQVFNIKDSEIKDTPDVIKNIKSDLSLNVGSDEVIDLPKSNDFDFNLLLDILSQSFVNITDVKKNINLINTEHELFGIDEITTARLIEQSTNVANNVFDPKKFKVIVSRQFQNNSAGRNQTTSKSDNSKQASNVNLNEMESKLVKSMRQYSPMEFLNSLKRAKGGYVHSNEERIISSVVERQILSSEVINMITYHILIDLGNSGLNRNLFEAIADDWSQNKIKSAEQALQFIKDRNKSNATPKSNKRYQRKNVVKETLPDWAKEDNKPKDYGKVNADKKKALQERIKQMQNNRNEG